MPAAPPPDPFAAAADRVVSLAAGGEGVVLDVPGAARVALGPYPNPAHAREVLAGVRAAVAALLRAAAGAPGSG